MLVDVVKWCAVGGGSTENPSENFMRPTARKSMIERIRQIIFQMYAGSDKYFQKSNGISLRWRKDFMLKLDFDKEEVGLPR
jgi:hypothetical protein